MLDDIKEFFSAVNYFVNRQSFGMLIIIGQACILLVMRVFSNAEDRQRMDIWRRNNLVQTEEAVAVEEKESFTIAGISDKYAVCLSFSWGSLVIGCSIGYIIYLLILLCLNLVQRLLNF